MKDAKKEKEPKKIKIIKKIVITGGSDAGKTTAMNWIQNTQTHQPPAQLQMSETDVCAVVANGSRQCCHHLNRRIRKCQNLKKCLSIIRTKMV